MKVLLFASLFVLLRYSVIASSTGIVTQYEAANALNQYGETVQIQNAQAVVHQYGRLVVAIRINHEKVWIVSPYCPVPPYERTHPAPRRLLEPVTSHSYLVCTGMQPDAAWLLHELQDYGKTILREINGVVVDPAIVASVYRQFLGYDTNRVWTGIGIGGAQDDEESSRLGRPLGVCSLLVSRRDCAGVGTKGVTVDQVDLSGYIRRLGETQAGSHLAFLAIGRCADTATDYLKEVSNENDLEDSLLNIFQLAVGAKKLQLEIMTGDGEIETRVLSR